MAERAARVGGVARVRRDLALCHAVLVFLCFLAVAALILWASYASAQDQTHPPPRYLVLEIAAALAGAIFFFSPATAAGTVVAFFSLLGGDLWSRAGLARVSITAVLFWPILAFWVAVFVKLDT